MQIKLVNINPSDIIEGKPSVVLGLVWTIILYFQVSRTSCGDLVVAARNRDVISTVLHIASCSRMGADRLYLSLG